MTVRKPAPVTSAQKDHSQRAHSKFSASGAERWFSCSGSVGLSEGMPDKSNVWAEEGTRAHEVLEKMLLALIGKSAFTAASPISAEMMSHCLNAADFIFGLHRKIEDSEILVEDRVYLDFIDPEAFGIFDAAVVDHWGTLHVFDFKYGASVNVPVKGNLQMIFYGLGLAHKYKWNFNSVRLWIIQPRIKGYDGPTFWDLPLVKLMKYVPKFRAAIKRVHESTGAKEDYVEGLHCYWCRAKSKCPLKTEAKLERAQMVFGELDALS